MPSVSKKFMMKELVREFDASPYAFFSSFDSLSVADISEFRRQIEKVSRRSVMVKHAMTSKILGARNFQEAEGFLKGQLLVTFGDADPQNTSKAIVEFAKTHQKLVPMGMIFENRIYGKEFVKRLAGLPSRKELLTQVVVRMKSPVTGFVMTLGQLTRGLVVALNEVRKKKELQTA